MTRILRQLWSPLLLIALAVVGIFLTQQKLTATTDRRLQAIENMAFVPRGDAIRPFLLGFDTVFGDVLWIKSILYFGSHYVADRNFMYLQRLLESVTMLNPHLYQPYEFAALMLPDLANDPVAAKIFALRGIGTLPRDHWQLWFYLGMIYFEYDKDPVQAAACFERAAHSPGAPAEKLSTLAATFYDRAGYRAHAIAFLSMIYETSENATVKQRVADKLRELTKPAG